MILSIDLGTSYFKFSLFDHDGRICDTLRIAAPVAETREGWMELPVEAFDRAIVQGIAGIVERSKIRSEEIEAVTFATQTNSFTLLDARDRPLVPLILWPDRRAEELDDEVARRCDFPGFSAITGFARANFQCMVAKQLWIQKHAPEVWRQAGKLCMISDYLTLLMTGEHVTEAGVAGLTGLADIRRSDWDSTLVSRFGLEHIRFPLIVRAGSDLGPICAQAAEHFGLPEGCRFIVGCLDQYAGAIGVGNVEPEIVSETTGTVLAAVRCSSQFAEKTDSHVLQGPGFRPGVYWQMCFGTVSANYLEWFQRQLPGRPDFEELVSMAEMIAPGAEGLRLTTEAEPSIPERVFLGLDSRHRVGHQVRCILEAVSFALGDHLHSLCNGSSPREIRCAGGAAHSDLWLQIKADILNIPTRATLCAEPTSMGAAMLAQAAFHRVDLQDVVKDWAKLKSPKVPNFQRHLQYQSLRCKVSP